MGEWDVYCAICATAFTGLEFRSRDANRGEHEENQNTAEPSSDDEEEEYYDDEAITPEECQWLGHAQVVGYNPDARGLQKAFLSGVGDGDAIQFGYLDVPPGSDPNFPREDLINGLASLTAYWVFFGDGIPCIPFHPDCYALLQRALGARTGRNVVNQDTLYNTLIALVETEENQRLGVDYGEPAPPLEQYWVTERGREIHLANPLKIRGLDEKLKTLPTPVPLSSSKLNLLTKVRTDIFAKLPYDVVHMVSSDLTPQDMLNLQTASWNVHQMEFGNQFWRSMIRENQRWFWEIDTLPDDVSFRSLSMALEKWSSFDVTKTSLENMQKGTLLHLANRKRIWGVAEYIASQYAEAPFDSDVEGDVAGQTAQWIRDHAVNRQMPPTILPNPRQKKDNKQESCFFVKNWHDARAGANILLHWSSGSTLVGITVNGNHFGNPEPLGGRMETVVLSPGDWLRAITLIMDGTFLDPRSASENSHTAWIAGVVVHTTAGKTHAAGSTSGPRRLISVSPSHTFVGLIGQTTPEGISRLGLLECARDEGVFRPPVPRAETLLWKHEVLPPYIRAMLFETGYGGQPLPMSFIPQEALILGTSHDELSRVRRIGVAVAASGSIMTLVGRNSQSRTSYLPVGLAVEYEGQERRTIGWCDEAHMSWFPIDGAAGERLTGVGIGMNERPKQLEFATSHGRHSQQYGDPQSNRTDWHEVGEGLWLVGIAASFGYPCGYDPAASETGGELYPKKHLGSTTINALVMQAPAAKNDRSQPLA